MKKIVNKYMIILLLIVFVLFAALFLALPLLCIYGFHGPIFEDVESVPAAPVAIVFGAGIRNGDTPSDMLADRLEIAAELYEKGTVRHILVSGDNRFVDYSEPDVMKEYLVSEFKIPEKDVFADYAGRRTYDTCIRAHELWGVDRAVLVSQKYHLPRALWTCKRLKIESVGVSASVQRYAGDSRYRLREIVAVYKAFADVNIFPPRYIGGERLTDLDP